MENISLNHVLFVSESRQEAEKERDRLQTGERELRVLRCRFDGQDSWLVVQITRPWQTWEDGDEITDDLFDWSYEWGVFRDARDKLFAHIEEMGNLHITLRGELVPELKHGQRGVCPHCGEIYQMPQYRTCCDEARREDPRFRFFLDRYDARPAYVVSLPYKSGELLIPYVTDLYQLGSLVESGDYTTNPNHPIRYGDQGDPDEYVVPVYPIFLQGLKEQLAASFWKLLDAILWREHWSNEMEWLQPGYTWAVAAEAKTPWGKTFYVNDFPRYGKIVWAGLVVIDPEGRYYRSFSEEFWFVPYFMPECMYKYRAKADMERYDWRIEAYGPVTQPEDTVWMLNRLVSRVERDEDEE